MNNIHRWTSLFAVVIIIGGCFLLKELHQNSTHSTEHKNGASKTLSVHDKLIQSGSGDILVFKDGTLGVRINPPSNANVIYDAPIGVLCNMNIEVLSTKIQDVVTGGFAYNELAVAFIQGGKAFPKKK